MFILASLALTVASMGVDVFQESGQDSDACNDSNLVKHRFDLLSILRSL